MKKMFLVLILAIIAVTGAFAEGSSEGGSSGGSSSAAEGDFMIVNADGLNVREGPGSNYASVGQLAKGTSVEVLDNSSRWYKIQSGSIVGYVNSDFLTSDYMTAPSSASSSSSSSSSGSSSSKAKERDFFEILSFPPSLRGNNVMIDAGIGLLPTSYLVTSILFDTKWKIIPLFVQAEYALPVGIPLSVGMMFSMYQYGIDFYSWESKWTDFIISTRANWHWGFNIKWLDFYTGLSVGYLFGTYEDNYYLGNYYDADSEFYWGFQAGAHFYFTKFFGAMVETGYPYWLKIGVSFKF